MEQVVKILTELRPEFDFTQSSDFISDGMLDSFDVVSLVTELDAKFNISIDGIDIIPENFKNLDSIKVLLKKKGVEI